MAKNEADMSTEVVETVIDVSGAGVDIAGEIGKLSRGEMEFFTTISGGDFNSRKLVLSAMQNSIPAADALNKPIKLTNYIIHPVTMTDEKTGEVTDQPRVILITEDGTAYHAISTGIYQSLKNIAGLLPKPSEWPEPLSVEIQEGRGRNGYKYMTLAVL